VARRVTVQLLIQGKAGEGYDGIVYLGRKKGSISVEVVFVRGICSFLFMLQYTVNFSDLPFDA
jgi:hypothetical protein